MKTLSHSAKLQLVDTEQRRENGTSMIVIGFMMWCFAALIFFFMPAGVRLGQQRAFGILIGSVMVAGLVVAAIGLRLRKQ
jgi:hypothetical protein